MVKVESAKTAEKSQKGGLDSFLLIVRYVQCYLLLVFILFHVSERFVEKALPQVERTVTAESMMVTQKAQPNQPKTHKQQNKEFHYTTINIVLTLEP